MSKEYKVTDIYSVPKSRTQRTEFSLHTDRLGKQDFVNEDLHKMHEQLEDQLDRNIIPRLPWHDVSCGSGARDVARHFIQSWNAIKYKKVKYNDNYPWLIPQAYIDIYTIKP